MLKLTVKQGESLKIGDDVKISLIMSNYGRIKLAIDAPEKVKIQRQKAETPKTKILITKGNGD